MKTTKTILTLAIIAALPFAAHATDPVVAVGPAHASSNPVVATANAPYVTVTPSQADESHIATTAYVKGAYNDAIAAVNNVANDVSGKQGQLVNFESGNNLSTNVVAEAVMDDAAFIAVNGTTQDKNDFLADQQLNLQNSLVTAGGVFAGMDRLAFLIEDKIDEEKQDKLTVNGDSISTTPVTDGSFFTQILDANMSGASGQEKQQIYSNLISDAGGESLPISTAVAEGFDYVGMLLKTEISNVQSDVSSVQTALNNKRVEIYTTWDDDTAKQQVAFVNAQ